MPGTVGKPAFEFCMFEYESLVNNRFCLARWESGLVLSKHKAVEMLA